MNAVTTQSTVAEQVVTALPAVFGPEPVALHERSFTGNGWLYLKNLLDSTFVSPLGNFIDRFEPDLAAFTVANSGKCQGALVALD